MATTAHVQVTYQVRSADVPADYCVHNLYFMTQGTPSPGDWTALVGNVTSVIFSKVGFGGSTPWTLYGGRAGTTKAYNLADPKPRPVMAMTTYTPTTWETAPLGPRALCSCLSYYSGRNLPHFRGRIYIGPFLSSQSTETPSNAIMSQIADLGHGLFNVATMGALSWQHSVHSTVTNQTNVATNYWTNDRWDVQHSREHTEQARLKYP